MMRHATVTGDPNHGQAENLAECLDWWALVRQEIETVKAGGHVSGGITAPEVINFYQGIAFANCLGRVLDVKLDVTWSSVRVVGEEAVAAANAKLLEYIDRWCAGMGSAAMYVWVLECGARRGLHTHIMLSLTDLALVELQKRCYGWISMITGKHPIETPDEYTYRLERSSDGFAGQWARFRYMMKGVNAHAVIEAPSGLMRLDQFAGIDRRYQGDISVPRAGCSAAIDAAARAPYVDQLPDMSMRVDGPQLYDDRFLDWDRARRGEPRHMQELAQRNAGHLVLKPPFA